MQLTMEVLPAPLGPMMENSSPSRTAKLTSVNARTPPNRKDTPRAARISSTQNPSRTGALEALFILCRSSRTDPISAVLSKPCDHLCFWLPHDSLHVGPQ